jgi:hypothetical protein
MLRCAAKRPISLGERDIESSDTSLTSSILGLYHLQVVVRNNALCKYDYPSLLNFLSAAVCAAHPVYIYIYDDVRHQI